MLNVLFFAPVALYFAAMVLQFAGSAFKKEGAKKLAWLALLFGAAVQTVYIIVRGVKAGRVPMANQFEFANAFAWGTALIGIFFKLRGKKKIDWMVTLCAPCAFLLISYAALQPREITELMPALRSVWFTSHIGTAVFSYASFAIAAAIGVRYLVLEKRETEKHLRELDALAYKLVCFGFLMLTIVILTGCIWAEQAWGSFWTWDPKEVWALITWIVYAIFLHQRVRMNWRGHRMAWFAIAAFIFVMFTFVGVNTLMSGLHSYA
jgi:cytochrome c-type biogenesis protein CcsB